MRNIPVYSIKIPEYDIKTKPDHIKIGSVIDELIKKHFLGRKVAIRGISLSDHKSKNVNELIKIIKKLGYDRYNPKRKGDRYENVEGKKIDIFALDFKINKKGKYIRYLIEPFYDMGIKYGGRPLRLDILLIYDFAKLKRVIHKYEGRNDIKRDGFIFRDSKNKKGALTGIIKVLN
ncbi:MAG: hypothetical protein AABW91_00050 [Nanoarchaeota archaeon]